MALTPFGLTGTSSWTTDGVISSVSVAANASSSNSNTISLYGATTAEVLAVECTVVVTYGTTITGGGATVYVARRTGSGWQIATDAILAYLMPVIASTAVNITFMLRGLDMVDAQIFVFNPTANSTITGVTLKTRIVQGGIN